MGAHARTSPARQALLAYARGVNDYLARARARHDWPPLFTLAGTYPAHGPPSGQVRWLLRP